MPGDCHYLEGNINARRRVEYIQDLLAQIGLKPERVQMFNMSAAMAGEFVAAATEMTERISTLGPNPLRAPLIASIDDRPESEP
jgi:F420-non-reducing hydrogenase iron-sulfur subunit